ncbi:NAD(P)H-binding protein [Actinokineospora guangxiensis]|uniref:NAD(P)H-binding protein n=1 Tax=Actinokineospora guangxiensis TaxID=1490288 RepID=A0ABW0EPJ1_9PSEU
MANNDILVLGATGTTGRRVVAQLRERGAGVRAASRSGEVRFDWDEPSTWEQAVEGARRLYLMAPDGQAVAEDFVRLAVDSGVRRVVLLSSQGIEVMGDQRLLEAERVVEAAGAEWVVVRPDWFNQNFDAGFLRPAVDAGVVALPVGDVRQAFIDADDIAAVAVAGLLEDGHAGETLVISGPRALSFGEALGEIGRATGREIRFAGEPDDYRAAMSFQDDAEIEGAIAAFRALAEQGDAAPTDTVERVTGRPPKDFATYVAESW